LELEIKRLGNVKEKLGVGHEEQLPSWTPGDGSAIDRRKLEIL
jgi:hypothetical protein